MNYEMDKDFNSDYRSITINGKLYRLQEYIDKTATDIHHLLGRKYRHKYNTNAEVNKVRISRRKHIALNQFFWDKQSPREQLLEVFNLVKPVLSNWVRTELSVILNQTTDDMFYTEDVLHGRNKKKRMERWEQCMQELNTDERKL